MIADLFTGGRTAAHLTSAEFTVAVARVLAPAGFYAANIGENAVHGSDSLDNAKNEIAYFFAASEVAPTAG